MAQTITAKAISRIITKGLTGWEAGKLILQDFIYEYYGMDSVLTEADTWAEFCYGWARVKWPQGDDTLIKAVEKALKAQDILPEAKEYDCVEVQLLIRVCYELQKITDKEPFWLSCRSAAGILGVSHTTSNKWLQMLVDDEILEMVEKNTATKATRFRYIAQ